MSYFPTAYHHRIAVRPPRSGHVFTGVPTMIRLGLLVWATVVAARGQVSSGDMFPSLSLTAPADGGVPSTQGRIVLVDFWASWCGPCKASFRALSRLHADFASRGLVIVGVSVDEKTSAYDEFINQVAPPFKTLLDREKKLVESVKVPAMPTSYVLGRDGRVRFVHQGFHGSATELELRSQIEALLAETPSTK